MLKMETKYFKDKYELYYSENRLKQVTRFVLGLFKSATVANAAGVIGTILVVLK